MRVVFASWAWPSHLLPLTPLAWAFRAAGHEVLVATQPPLVGAVTAAGLPAVAVGSAMDHTRLLGSAMRPLHPDAAPAPAPAPVPAPGRRRRLGLSVRVAEDMVDGLARLCAAWQPSLVLHEPTTYAAPLAAASLGIAHAPVLWGVNFHDAARAHEAEAFAGLSARLGVDGFDSRGLVTVDPCPPSLQVPSAHPRLGLRHVPYNGPGVVPPWLRRPGRPDRPRICLTWGVSPHWANEDEHARAVEQQHRLIAALAGLDVDIVVATSSREAVDETRLPADVRVVERLPLHLLLPGCDLMIARGGAGSMMTALAAGVPQLCVPQYVSDLMPAERLAATGAALSLGDTPTDPEAVRDAAALMLRTPAFAGAAARLRAEAEGLPSAAAVVRRLTAMVSGAERPMGG
ncbi:DUF1205 domain-containing protein [Streptomyces polychromogenes]|uniref:DUF1205 domain-containing protein n=1 Tax=Streptomyces polychromogenes TaxID=67342 RepID=A0ABP3F5Y1_9ACTN